MLPKNVMYLVFLVFFAFASWRCGDLPPEEPLPKESTTPSEQSQETPAQEIAQTDTESPPADSNGEPQPADSNNEPTTEPLSTDSNNEPIADSAHESNTEQPLEPSDQNDASETTTEPTLHESSTESPLHPEEATHQDARPPEVTNEFTPEKTPEALPETHIGSSGCGKNPPVTGLQENMTLTVMNKQRNYVLSVPANYNKNTLHPVIFGFPGLNATGKQARGYLGLEKTPGPAVLYVYPTAQVVSSGWQMQVGGGDIEFFDEILKKLETEFCVDTKRIFSTGFSHGAMFTNNLTCVRIQKLRAVAPIGGSGPWYNNCKNGPLPAMVIHGTTDTVVKLTDGEKTRDHWKTQNACTNTSQSAPPSPCVAYRSCTQPTLWCAFQGGHQVPSFAGTGIRDFFLGLP